jgi:hypothetical protein
MDDTSTRQPPRGPGIAGLIACTSAGSGGRRCGGGSRVAAVRTDYGFGAACIVSQINHL